MQSGTDVGGEATMWVRHGQAELAVTTVGQGTPLLALHAGVCDRRSWRRCAELWAGAGYRTVAYDRRGYGQTRYRREPHDDLADLRAVTEAAGARPAIVVGNSMGGALAIDLALAAPDEVLALVLIGALPTGAPEEAWVTSAAEAALDERATAAQQAGDVDAVNRIETHYWLDGPAQPEGRVAGAARELMLDMNGRALRADPPGESTTRAHAWPSLPEITVPTLIVVGEYDESGLGAMSRLMAERLPDATLVDLPLTAHCPSLDRPEALARVVGEALSGIGSGGR